MAVPFGSLRLERLVKRLGRLPGIGSKSAARLALHLLYADESESEELISALREVKAHVRPCSRCGSIAEDEFCQICQDARRDAAQLCVVANATDVFTMERAAIFRVDNPAAFSRTASPILRIGNRLIPGLPALPRSEQGYPAARSPRSASQDRITG